MTLPMDDGTVACAVCGSAAPEPFVRLSGLPVLCNVLWPTRDEALAAPRGDVELAFCAACGMIANLAFDEELIGYDPGYENSLHFSEHFQDFARGLAIRLVDTYGIRGKTVVEIGSGKGDFLKLVCEAGDNDGIGYDPSYDGATGAPSTGRVRFVPALWDGHVASADLVCCRHVLEHAPEPRRLVDQLGAALAGRDAVVYFEVPDAAYMLRAKAIYDIVYEHCSYFAAPALVRLFTEAGFEVRAVGTSFGGQYLYVEGASRGTAVTTPPVAPGAVDELAGLVRCFEADLRTTVEAWAERLERLTSQGCDVVLWGAGSKGVTFLNMVPGGERLSRIVDVNPRKRHRFVPGSGQQVVAPEDLVARPPHTVVVMNPLYLDEVRTSVAELGLSPDVIGVQLAGPH